MKLSGVCIMTDDVPKLVRFYEAVLLEKAEGDAVHSAFNASQLAIYNPGNVEMPCYKNMALMYKVTDADAEYERLKSLGFPVEFESAPSNKPWGVRSFIFIDPDGNQVSFLSPLK